MKSLRLLILLLHLFHSSMAEVVDPDDYYVPAYEFSSNSHHIRLDNDTLQYAQYILDHQSDNDPILNVPIERRAPDNVRVAQIVRNFRTLLFDAALLEVVQLSLAVVGVHINPNWDRPDMIPQFADADLEAALHETLPQAGVYIPQFLNIYITVDIRSITVALLGIAYEYFLKGYIDEDIILVCKDKNQEPNCPSPLNCGNSLCFGSNGQCSKDGFYPGCDCSQCDAGDLGKLRLLCEEMDCGTVDSDGFCTGNPDTGEFAMCPCSRAPRFEPQYFDQSSLDAIESLMAGEDRKKPTPDYPKEWKCYHDETGLMENEMNWKFLQAQAAYEAIQQFCSSYQQTESDQKDVERKQTYWGEDENDWNTVDLAIFEPKGGNLDKNRCFEMFKKIQDCDKEEKLNQFDYKWGGEYQDEDGVKVTVKPVWGRVGRDHAGEALRNNRICRLGSGFTVTNDNKGNDGTTMDNKARMALVMCIHQMRYFDGWNESFDCGGLLNMKINNHEGYKSIPDCVGNTYRCLTELAFVGFTGKAEHRPASPHCIAQMWYLD